MEAGFQEGGLQVSSSLIPPSPLSQVHGVFSNRDLQLLGGNQVQQQ